MEAVNPFNWASFSPWGVVAAMVGLIALGLLVPNRSVKNMVEPWKSAAGQWKEAHDTLVLKLDVVIETNRALMELLKTQEQLLRGLPHAGGGTDVPVAQR